MSKGNELLPLSMFFARISSADILDVMNSHGRAIFEKSVMLQLVLFVAGMCI